MCKTSATSEHREIEDIPADELNILICRFMMDIKKKVGGVYEPTTLASFAFCFASIFMKEKNKQKQNGIHRPRSVHIERNCALGLEYRPRSMALDGRSRPPTQFLPIQTSPAGE